MPPSHAPAPASPPPLLLPRPEWGLDRDTHHLSHPGGSVQGYIASVTPWGGLYRGTHHQSHPGGGAVQGYHQSHPGGGDLYKGAHHQSHPGESRGAAEASGMLATQATGPLREGGPVVCTVIAHRQDQNQLVKN